MHLDNPIKILENRFRLLLLPPMNADKFDIQKPRFHDEISIPSKWSLTLKYPFSALPAACHFLVLSAFIGG